MDLNFGHEVKEGFLINNMASQNLGVSKTPVLCWLLTDHLPAGPLPHIMKSVT